MVRHICGNSLILELTLQYSLVDLEELALYNQFGSATRTQIVFDNQDLDVPHLHLAVVF